MSVRGAHPEPEKRSDNRPHEDFLELCALSTSGELTDEERKGLEDHLLTCAECRKVLREFEAVADIGVPLLSSELSSFAFGEVQHHSPEPIRTASARPLKARDAEFSRQNEQGKRVIFSEQNGDGRGQRNWNNVWASLAAAVLLAFALGMYSYRFGRQKGQETVQAKPTTLSTSVDTLELQVSDAGHEQEILRSQLKQRDQTIAELRREVTEQSAVLTQVKRAEADLEHALESDQAEKQQLAEERKGLLQKIDATEAFAEKTQSQFDSLRHQRSEDESHVATLEAQIRDLNGLLNDREQTINKQEELLSNDRDIRDLMGARELYIAEVYDVARDGSTQKPYGRVFYTKGKSLVFYAYDLDKQPQGKNATTFQAWGRGGPDRQQMLSLGIFFEDSVAKKRWVLKFDDGHTLDQIDAVFVTVEPKGGSNKPSGKPLLFASLRIVANHP
jgi:Anti-sigma-K factor rskA/Putative zinc-finger